MKKIISILVVVIFTMTSIAQAVTQSDSKKVNPGAVTSLVKEYYGTEGFEIVSIGSFGLGLTRIIAKASADTPEDREMLGILDNLNRVVVVDFEEADGGHKGSFVKKISALLENAEKIIEIKDGGETFNLYGTSSEGGERIDDIIIFVPEDCALICLFGSISAQKIADIIEIAND